MSLKLIGFRIVIESVSQAKIIPKIRNIVNRFDLIGTQLSTSRLQGEGNIDYRNRLFDVAIHPSSPLYDGVISGIARDFGFIREKTLLIDLNKNSDGSSIAERPRVDILANRIILYSSWSSADDNTIDKEIYFYKRDSEGYYLGDLINSINSSQCFSASSYPDVRLNMHSFLLTRLTSTISVYNDLIRPDLFTKFILNNIIDGTLWFEEKDIFTTEVYSEPTKDGEYYVDYENGWVKPYKTPSGKGRCGYQSAGFPLRVDSVPIQAFSMHDDNFKKELFIQEELASGEETNALPNFEGSEIFHQLFKETKVFWGK